MTSRTVLLWAVTLLFVVGVAKAHPAASDGAVATFVRSDPTTQGGWKGVYGIDGNAIADTTPWFLPSYATFTPENQANYTWTGITSDPRALQAASSSPTSMRQATAWYNYSGNSYDLNINFTDGNAHQFALYALDWDSTGRSESIQVTDANSGAVLNTQVISNFTKGIFLIWNISGHVKINVTKITGSNAVVSGAFFQPIPGTSQPAGSGAASGNGRANFLASDTSTQGNWQGAYGADGYALANSAQKSPSYATFTVQNQTNYSWVANTTDSRALQTGAGTARIAATWFANSTFNFDVNVTDGNSHPFALYLLDWDSSARIETVKITDSLTNAVLDARSISNFNGGIYLIWSVAGHVKITMTVTGGPNAVVSGAFFGGSGSSTTTANNTASTNGSAGNGSASSGSTNTASAPSGVTASVPASVSVTPSNVTLNPGQTQSFVASVQNSTNTSVTWSISPTIGAISSSGVYTAPANVASAQSITVTATSVGVPSSSAVSTITLIPLASGLPSGLVLHWTFDAANTSGTIEADSSNNGGSGTIAGNPAVVTGTLNQAFNFNGVNSYVSMYAYGDKATEFSNSITLAAWINTTNTSRPEAIISKFTAAGSGGGYIFRTDTAGHLEFIVGAGNLAAYPSTVVDTATVNDGRWHHVAAVVNIGQNVQFFVDGKLSSTSPMYTLANGDQWSNLEVGSSSYTSFGNYFTGSIDDVQVYNRALGSAEVNTIFTLAGGSQNQASTTQSIQSSPQTTASSAAVAQGQLSLSSASFNFGKITIESSASQAFSISNSGNANLTISNVSLSGPGLNATGVSPGTVLTPGQSTALMVTFTPASAGSVTGSVTISSNTATPNVAISLAGTGIEPAPAVIVLTWGASGSAGILGYDVYRGTTPGGPYLLLTQSPVPSTAYTDTTAQVGQTYYYVVTSVNAANVQSAYSNAVSVALP